MKNLYYTAFFLFISCFTSIVSAQDSTKILAENSKDIKSGKCYTFSLTQKDDNAKQAFLLEIVNPVCDIVKKEYTLGALDSLNKIDEKIQVPISKTYDIIKLKRLLSFNSTKGKHDFEVCSLVNPAKIGGYTMQEIYDKRFKVDVMECEGNAVLQIRYVEKRPEKMQRNQYYYEGGQWDFEQLKIAVSYGKK